MNYLENLAFLMFSPKQKQIMKIINKTCSSSPAKGKAICSQQERWWGSTRHEEGKTEHLRQHANPFWGA